MALRRAQKSRLDGRSPVPLHHQLKAAIARDVRGGRYRPGDRIPSERALCEAYGVSRTTVRHTVSQLVHEGGLVRVPAKGTFVAPHKIEQDLAHVSRFSETVTAAGRVPGIRVLSTTEIDPPENISLALELSPGDRVVRIDVVGYADVQPLVLYRVHLKSDVGASVAAELRRAQAAGGATFRMILDHLKEAHGLSSAWAVQSYEAGLADAATAALLGMRAGDPVFLSTRTIYADEGSPIEHDEVVYRGDQYRFTIRRIYA